MTDERGPDLRRTFDKAAASYHEARPSYPEEVFDRLAEFLPAGPSILEVGPGTGQATEPLLRRGANIQAVEIGPRLAVELSHRLTDYLLTQQLEVVVADYEVLEPVPGSADAVVSATAYHWVSSEEQLTRPRQWLVPDGRLAVIDTMQVTSTADGGYFAAAHSIYERYGQASGARSQEPDLAAPPIHGRMVSHEECADVTLDRWRWDQTYSAVSYRALLNTYSGTLAMEEPARSEMVDALVQLVDEMGGEVTRPLVITLATCRFQP